jgi:hypothetical protein
MRELTHRSSFENGPYSSSLSLLFQQPAFSRFESIAGCPHQSREEIERQRIQTDYRVE